MEPKVPNRVRMEIKFAMNQQSDIDQIQFNSVIGNLTAMRLRNAIFKYPGIDIAPQEVTVWR